ncbi:MAG: hypothetical protein KAS39_00645 [Actinomycetia bacterium]|nr:hypothetical protein [Actinomycetes bacterium]
MNLKQFISIAGILGIPPGNYLFKSSKTLIIYWFMVSLNYDKTLLEVFKPGCNRYVEMDQARILHRKMDKQHNHHKNIINQLKKELKNESN